MAGHQEGRYIPPRRERDRSPHLSHLVSEFRSARPTAAERLEWEAILREIDREQAEMGRERGAMALDPFVENPDGESELN